MARGRYALVRDDVEAAAAHSFDWICHFQDGVTVDTASGWVQGIGKGGQSLGVRVVSPVAWTAQTGSQTAELMNQFDPDGQTSYVRVRPASSAAAQQFLTALMPVATASWAQRTPVSALSAADPGAGAVVAAGSALEERWIFARAGSAGKAAGDLALSGALAGMAARDASGAPLRTLLFGAGQLSDQAGARLLLSTTSATAIEASGSGATLVVTGAGIADFQAYAPAATAVMLNGQVVSAKFEAGMVTYPGSPIACCAPPPDAGGADASVADAGTPDAGVDSGAADAGATDAGATDSGALDAGTSDAGADAGTSDAGADAGTCCAAPDAGAVAPPAGTGPGTSADAGAAACGPQQPCLALSSPAQGCSSTGASAGWLALAGAFVFLRRRR